MAQREQKTKTATKPEAAEVVEDAPKAEHRTGDELKAEMDELLDEIDEVLEENAADFVKDYIQKGGQ